jgi:adenylate kinase family enzyme
MNATTLKDIAPEISASDLFKAPTKRKIEISYREEVIACFIEEAQALVLDEIVMSTVDLRFDSLCHELAGFLGSHVSEAVKILAPVVQKLYQAANEAAHQRGPS